MEIVRRSALALTFALFLLGSCCFLLVALVQGAFVLREVRFDVAGVAATGTVTATRTCTYSILTDAADDNTQITGETITVRYLDRHGARHVAETHFCIQRFYSVGEQVAIRYLPADPGDVATSDELENTRLFLIVEIVLLPALLATSIGTLVAFVRGLRLIRRARKQYIASLPPYQDAPIPPIPRALPGTKTKPWELP